MSINFRKITVIFVNICKLRFKFLDFLQISKYNRYQLELEGGVSK